MRGTLSSYTVGTTWRAQSFDDQHRTKEEGLARAGDCFSTARTIRDSNVFSRGCSQMALTSTHEFIDTRYRR